MHTLIQICTYKAVLPTHLKNHILVQIKEKKNRIDEEEHKDMVKTSEKLHLVPVFFIQHIAATQKREQQNRTDNFKAEKKFVNGEKNTTNLSKRIVINETCFSQT